MVGSIRLDIVDALRANESGLRSAMDGAVERYGLGVMAELAAIHGTYDPGHIARSAVVFGLVSPQADFAFNVAVTQPLLKAIRSGAGRTELAAIIRSHYLGLHNQKSERLSRARRLIRTVTADDMTRETVSGFPGFGPKVTSMTIALCNPWAHVFTLDRHMLRILCDIAGYPYSKDVTDAAYREVERYCVDVVRRWYPSLPVFAVQWSLWNGAFGRHMEHMPLFEYVPRYDLDGRGTV